jgi:hypothetical protein
MSARAGRKNFIWSSNRDAEYEWRYQGDSSCSLSGMMRGAMRRSPLTPFSLVTIPCRRGVGMCNQCCIDILVCSNSKDEGSSPNHAASRRAFKSPCARLLIEATAVLAGM